jgi:dTDP-4-dehydrorhamnose 3,5-epimerase
MSEFQLQETPLAGLRVVERNIRGDDRGFFSRFFCAEAFAQFGWDEPIAQINHSYTKARGSLRGMHCQNPPAAETKLVSCLRGEIYDVAVDLRVGSATFMQWYGCTLSPANRKSLLVPKGFAHGFQTLSDDCELIYLHSHPYTPASERAVNALDPALAIAWPMAVTKMSDRDAAHPMIDESFAGIIV